MKLWIVALVLMGISLTGAIFGAKVYDNQGRVWIAFEDSREEGVEYILTANIIDGISTKKTKISETRKHKLGFLNKENNPSIYPRDLFGDEDYEFVVVGSDYIFSMSKKKIPDYYTIWYILKKTEKGLEIVPKKGGEFAGDAIDPAFKGSWLKFIDLDGDGILEVRESALIPHSNAMDQVWHEWYKYNSASGLYEFVRRDKEQDPEARYKIGKSL